MGVTRMVVLAGLLACGGKSDEPAGGSAAVGSGTAGSAALPPGPGIQLPVVTTAGDPVVNYFAVTIAPDALHALGPITLADPDSGHPQLVVAGQTLAVDDHGKLARALPPGDSVSAPQLADKIRAANLPPRHTLVFADAAEKAPVLDAIHLAGEECSNIAAVTGGQLTVLPVCWPLASADAVSGRVDLVLVVTPGETVVMTTQISNLEHATDAAQLSKILGLRKASSYFADRNDAHVIVKPDTTIANLATVIAELRKAGFIDVRFAREAKAPTPLSPRPGGELPANDASRSVTVAVDCPRVDGAAIDVGQRVVRSRIGVFRACFQRDLARGAHDGDADVSFGVKDGHPTSVTVAGNVPSSTIGDCLKNQIARLTFPTSVTAVRCAFTFKH